jgi:CRP/FNR family transcriptional regulator, cyclic AMP receptor protein
MPSEFAAYDALKKAPLFSDLTEDELHQIAKLFRERQFPQGKVIVREGQSGEVFFVIKSGTAVVSARGEEQAMLSVGDYFGEIALFDDGLRTATITASDELVCYALPHPEFRKLVENDGVIGWKLLHRLTRIIRDLRH